MTADTDFQTLTVQRTGGVARALIDNGEINLMDEAMFADLERLVDRAEADDDVRVLVIASANEEFFVAHADVRAWVDGLAELPPPSAEPNAYQQLFRRLRDLPKPTIAVVEGYARGGGTELALATDMCFAAAGRAVFANPEIALGAIPGFGATQYLPRAMARGRALEIVLGGGDVDARTAELYGLVTRCLEPAELWPYVDALTARIASFPPAAVAAAKRAVDASALPLDDGLRFENDQLMAMLVTPDLPRRMRRLLDLGGQTLPFERRFGDRLLELGNVDEENA